MSDKRLFHRYTASVRVAFRVRGESHRGRLVNVGAGGGYVVSKALPAVGTRVQMAALADPSRASIWLEMRVTWENEHGVDGAPNPGFGGYWLHALSRESEEHLREFLSSVLGITRAVVRPVSPPAGGEIVYMFRFADVYEGVTDEDFPWLEPRAQVGVRPADPRFRDESPWLAAEPPEVVLSIVQPLPGYSPDGQGASSVEQAAAQAQKGANRWQFLIERLSGVRSRDKGASGVIEAPQATQVSNAASAPTQVFTMPPTAEMQGLASGGATLSMTYKLGRKSHPGRVSRLGTGWLVFETTAEVPALWARILIVMPSDLDKKKARDMEIHAQVTRIKQGADGAPSTVHGKIVRVDEKGATGAYSRYIEAFGQRAEV